MMALRGNHPSNRSPPAARSASRFPAVSIRAPHSTGCGPRGRSPMPTPPTSVSRTESDYETTRSARASTAPNRRG
jgi:hypothetical protein